MVRSGRALLACERFVRPLVGKKKRDVYQCRPFVVAGIPLEEDDDFTGGSSSSVEELYKNMERHNGLYAGIPYGGGEVLEIYPCLNKITVQMKHGEIQYLNLDKVVQKIQNGLGSLERIY